MNISNTINPKSSNLRIVYFAPGIFGNFRSGGAFVHITGLSNALSELGHEVHIVLRSTNRERSTTRLGPRILLHETRLPFAGHSFLSKETIRSLIYYPTSYRKILRLARDNIYDVFYARYTLNNPWTVNFARWLSVPTVLEINDLPFEHKNFLTIRNFLAQLTFAEALTTQTDSQAAVIRRICNKRTHVIPCGVNTFIFKPLNGLPIRRSLGMGEDDLIVVFSGSFATWAGTQIFPEIITKLGQQFPRVKFLIVGGVHPSDPNSLWKLWRETSPKTSQTIIFTGWVPYEVVPQLLSTADIFIHLHHFSPAVKGGWPNWLAMGGGAAVKLFEYMAMGKPTVAFDYPEIRKILQDSASYARPGDIEDFVSKMGLLLQDTELRKQLGEKSRKIAVEHHSWTIRARTLLDVFREVAV